MSSAVGAAMMSVHLLVNHESNRDKDCEAFRLQVFFQNLFVYETWNIVLFTTLSFYIMNRIIVAIRLVCVYIQHDQR